MNAKIRSILFSILFVSSSVSSQSVYPEAAKSLPLLEIGEAILFLMPSKKLPYLNWSYLGDSSSIEWLDDGYVIESFGGEQASMRRGLMRIRVNNKKSTVLKKSLRELAWTVRFMTLGMPKFGFQTIKLSSGPPGDECFGSLYDGCDFNPINSMRKSGVKIKKICSNDHVGNGLINGYELSHPMKKTVLARVEDSFGSGGIATDFVLDFTANKKDLCDYEKAFR